MGDPPPDGARPPESDEELVEFVAHAPVGLCWVDPDGRMLWTNRTELQLLGISEHECVGHPIAEFFIEPRAAADILSRLGSQGDGERATRRACGPRAAPSGEC